MSSARTAPQTKAAVHKLDAVIGKLKTKLDATHLPIDLIVVSDHGMAKTQGDWITLDKFADLTGFETAGYLLYGKTEEDAARVYNQLKHATSEFMVYRRKNVPAGLNYRENPREGDPVVIATGPYRDSRAWAAGGQAGSSANGGSAWIRSAQDAGDEGELLCAGGPDLVHHRTL